MFFKKETPFYLAGKWVTSSAIERLMHPVTKKEESICLAQAEHIEEAIAKAHFGKNAMAQLRGYEKEKILLGVASGIEKRGEEIAQTITRETGKTIRDARLEVSRSVNTFRVAAEEAKRIGGEVIPMDWIERGKGRFAFTQRFPIGPVAGITPFNYPFNLSTHKVAPAIAAGNPVILKPPPQAPQTGLFLAHLFEEAGGLPEGGLSVLPCSVDHAVPLVEDERIKLLSFTGSAAVGWTLKSKAGKKRVVLELGGIASVAVDEGMDGELERVVAACVQGSFVNAGQVCLSIQRIFVHQTLFKKFCAAFVEKTGSLRVGDPFDEKSDMGPLISTAAAERVEKWVNEAVAKGAELLIGGKREGAYYQPTVLIDVPPDASISCEEVFGPVVMIEPFTRWEEAIERIDDTPYGLQAGIFTADIKRAFYAFSHIRAGAVLIGDTPAYRIDHMPYGGVKNSGFGREGLKYAIEEMTELRLAIFNDVWK